MNEKRPAPELRRILKEIFPPDSADSPALIDRIDSGLVANGEFRKYFYESCINYVFRRLITVAVFLRRQLESLGIEEIEISFVEYLRRHIRDQLSVPEAYNETLLTLLRECVRLRGKQVSKGVRNSVLSMDEELRCYICGKPLVLEDAQLDHIWPRALGGSSDPENLRVSCGRCNSVKSQYLDASDFHFEEICMTRPHHDPEFPNQFQALYRIAVAAKTGFTCKVCGRPASEVGGLSFGRDNGDDSWHFLNVDGYCECADSPATVRMGE